MKLNKTTSYAIRIISRMVQSDRRLSTVELAELEGISRGILTKILEMLKQEGVVISHQGVAGGFALTKKGRSMNIYEIITIMQGEMHIHPEIEKELYQKRNCQLYKRLEKVNELLTAELTKITIK